MLKSTITIVLLATSLFLCGSVAWANTYVSLNGEFYFDYPDDWEQIDFRTVDLFLTRSGASQDMFDYDAVLAPSTSSPFFAGDYLILTVEKTGELNNQEIDSVLSEYGESFQSGITYLPMSHFMTDLKSNAPSYDRETRVMTVLNDILSGQESVKKNLIMAKFYDKGIATFYFYSTDSLFDQSKKSFEDMVASFETENYQDMVPTEEVKVADIETDEEGNLKTNGSNLTLYLSIAVVILLGLVVVMKIRK